MFGLGTKEIIIIAVVLVLLFGSRKIPELAKSIVEAVKHLKSIFVAADTNDRDASSGQNKKK